MDKPIAHLKGTRLIIWDNDDANKIYSLGFFGKPIGISKVKNSDFDSHLILDLVEGKDVKINKPNLVTVLRYFEEVIV